MLFTALINQPLILLLIKYASDAFIKVIYPHLVNNINIYGNCVFFRLVQVTTCNRVCVLLKTSLLTSKLLPIVVESNW